MKLKQLCEFVEKTKDLSADTECVVPGNDHSYVRVGSVSIEKVRCDGGDYYEAFETSAEHKPNAEVVVIS